MNLETIKLLGKVEAKIVEIEADIKSCPITKEEADAAAAKFHEIFSGDNFAEALTELGKEAYEKISCANVQATRYDHVAMLTETMDLDLFQVDEDSKYLLVDKQLQSPSGFHPTELVFVKTDVCIQLTKLPKNWSDDLIAYDVAKLRESA